jgi:hypothetical protein
MICLMVVVSGAFVMVEGLCLLAMALVHPLFVHSLFPVPLGRLDMVGSILASVVSGKYWPPQ